MASWYPDNLLVPESLRTAEFLIRPLHATDVVLDYDAVISSRAELWLRSGGEWPREGFTLEENLADLEFHEREHQERIAFTYTVMNPTESECLGCIYVNPLRKMLERAGENPEQIAAIVEREAWVTFWVRQSRLADQLDTRLLQALMIWFRTDWSFTRVVFAARKEQQRQLHLFEEMGMRLLHTLPRSCTYEL